MIIKKPYAFLIKHFRLIHLVLAVCLGIILIRSNSLVSFVNDYADTGKFVHTADLPVKYVPFILFLLCFVIFIFAAVVDYLMKWKKKKRVYYVSLMVFYLILIIVFIVYRSFLGTILDSRYSDQVIRAYRDMIKIFTYPQYYFFLVALLRAIGFDLKKFDFKKDAQELEIDVADSEEVEVVFKSNSYKFKRACRKFFRDLKYNLREYQFLYMLITIIIVVILSVLWYKNVYLKNDMLGENEYFNINNVEFVVDSSYIASTDYAGKNINNNYFVVVLVNMFNYGNTDSVLGLENFKLKVDGKILNASLTYAASFIDLGKYYSSQTLYANDEQAYYFVYQIGKDDLNKNFVCTIINNDTKESIDIGIKPVNIDGSEQETFNLGDSIVLNGLNISDTSLQVNGYEFGYKFEETYEYCLNKCYDANYTFTAKNVNSGKNILMKMNIEYTYNSNMDISSYLTSIKDFMSAYGVINYNIDGYEKYEKVVIKENENIKTDNVYIELPEEIKDASGIILSFTIRNKTYKIVLK